MIKQKRSRAWRDLVRKRDALRAKEAAHYEELEASNRPPPKWDELPSDAFAEFEYVLGMYLEHRKLVDHLIAEAEHPTDGRRNTRQIKEIMSHYYAVLAQDPELGGDADRAIAWVASRLDLHEITVKNIVKRSGQPYTQIRKQAKAEQYGVFGEGIDYRGETTMIRCSGLIPNVTACQWLPISDPRVSHIWRSFTTSMIKDWTSSGWTHEGGLTFRRDQSS